MSYILYYSPGACSMAPHILLEELRITYRAELLSVANGDNVQPYLSINAKERVPALMIPGEARVLTEVPAIMTCLARHEFARELLPADDPLFESRCLEWFAWLSGWLHQVGFGLLWRPGRFSPDTSQHQAQQAIGRETIQAAFAEIERQIADGKEWAMPGRYSAVDPFLLVFYRWGNRIGVPMRTDFPAWTSISDRVAKRPAVLRVLESEGVSIEM
ncbi:MAG: glutathione S-transferase N-terminal domain-containing protein [Mesorhizobium sp.]